ncbi:MAG: FoF1 ATP synthase subunit a [Anaerolineales bacterium]
MEETRKGWRWGVNRWLIVLLLVASVVAAGAISPIMPHVQLPAERLTHEPLFTLPVVGEFYLTNTLVATLIGDVLLVLMAFAVRRGVQRGSRVLTGIAGLVETLVEALYNLVESTAGKWARTIFPYFATIVFLVLLANWLELIPGVDSIGIIEHTEHGYAVREVIPGVETIVEDESDHGEFALVPFVRVASTDLNFTVAIALISVVMTQVIGVRALGLGYFGKFLAFKGFFRMWTREDLGAFDAIFPFIDLFVGILETVAEFAKILSFSFRLFGNIFAGSVLLFVMGSLLPMIQSGFLILELFVGLIQALVFGMLTMVFMTMAVQSHDDHNDH